MASLKRFLAAVSRIIGNNDKQNIAGLKLELYDFQKAVTPIMKMNVDAIIWVDIYTD